MKRNSFQIRVLKGISFLLFLFLHFSAHAEIKEKLAGKSNDFATKITQKLLKSSPQKNVFFSPYSLYVALSMLSNGAAGNTYQDLSELLWGERSMPLGELNQGLFEMQNEMHSNQGMKLTVANSLWGRSGVGLRPMFQDDLKKYYKAEVSEINFSAADASGIINSWVESKTNGKIKNLIGPRISNEVMLIILNALYFKADWLVPFRETYERKFSLNETQFTSHPTMMVRSSYAYLKTDRFEAIEIPYKNEVASMVVILPKVGEKLSGVEEHLLGDRDQLKSLLAALEKTDKKMGELLLPKLQFEYQVGLKSYLKELGLAGVFDTSANLEKLVDTQDKLFIHDVIQKTFLAVTEKGTEAAAATGLIIGTTSIPQMYFRMDVNRPYFFLIKEKVSGQILFIGSIVDPSQSGNQ